MRADGRFLPRFGRSVMIFAAFILVSSYSQFLMLPFERAFTPVLRTAPALIVAIPIYIAAAFQIAVWFVVSGSVTGWVRIRYPDDPLARIRTSLAVVAWSHIPLLLFAVISLPLVVSVVRAFDGIVISQQSVAARPDAVAPLKIIGSIRPWSWLASLAMLVITVAVHRRSGRDGCGIVLPPVILVVVSAYALFSLLPS
jgi:hypothetical protein